MDTTSTYDIDLMEEISLNLKKILEELPDVYFQENGFSPSENTVEAILYYQKIIQTIS